MLIVGPVFKYHLGLERQIHRNGMHGSNGVAQFLERWFSNQKVLGTIPEAAHSY